MTVLEQIKKNYLKGNDYNLYKGSDELKTEKEFFLERRDFEALFTGIFTDCGLKHFISERNIDCFYGLIKYMNTAGKKINVTSITDPGDIICRHFADSVMTAEFIPYNASVIDVGTGGGFPSLPLAIVRPDLKITAIDSTVKKIRYAEGAAAAAGVVNITAAAGRAEELSSGEMRESFDAAVSRAVAAMPVLCELCIPFVKTGGSFIAMKGPSGDSELQSAQAAIGKLGGEFAEKREYILRAPDEEIKHALFIVRKAYSTPVKYPRNFSQINKKTL